jgi:hypothetical protein
VTGQKRHGQKRRAQRVAGALDALVELAPPLLTDAFGADCCIAATKVAVEVLGYFGIQARPLVTAPTAMNPAAARWLVTRRGEPCEVEEWWEQHGCFMGGLVRTPGPDRFLGHLVAIVERTQLLDLSLGQMTYPERNLRLPPAAAVPLFAGQAADQPLAAFHDAEGTVLYYAHTNTDWEDSPDWADTGGSAVLRGPVVLCLIRAIEQRSSERSRNV